MRLFCHWADHCPFIHLYFYPCWSGTWEISRLIPSSKTNLHGGARATEFCSAFFAFTGFRKFWFHQVL